ncbi:hypothetical protein [Conexibacter arvalis]|uniref:Uncharacterized protein n=1 Tax=Conexibacter arvalis TaxID=912552 RepID=A0A840IBP6_9ACTN|nr:hypothetical protein [Conexibacter arvalis]MBB4662347.1 hypothetical protein [Conexibacter arvalis]
MNAPLFRLVCVPAALEGAPDGWAADLLRDADVALLVDGSGLAGIDTVAHRLGQPTVPVVRREPTAAEQDETVIAHAGALPLIWIGSGFSDRVRTWARDRGAMTLLVETDGSLPDDERRRVERFAALLGRQAE